MLVVAATLRIPRRGLPSGWAKRTFDESGVLMANQSYWDWVRHVPPVQKVPEDLWTPTGVPHINLMIKMLTSDLLGNDGVELVGRVITEAARFNMWFVRSIDGRTSPERQAALYHVYQQVCPKIYQAWKNYESACASSVPEYDDDDDGVRLKYEALLAALSVSAADLATAQDEGISPG